MLILLIPAWIFAWDGAHEMDRWSRNHCYILASIYGGGAVIGVIVIGLGRRMLGL